jgi:amidase
LDDVIKENQLDAICGLTMGPACSIDNIWRSLGRCFLTTPAAASGRILQCLAESTNRLSFFGTAYSEPELIGLAYAFEQASITELNLVSRNLL